jgi:hypothetical protein
MSSLLHLMREALQDKYEDLVRSGHLHRLAVKPSELAAGLGEG